MLNISSLKKELSNKINNINQLSDNIEINNILESLIVEITNAEFSSIWMYEFPILYRQRNNEKKEISIDKKSGLIYECFAKKQAVIYNYLSSQKGYVPEIDNPDNIKIKSKIMIPLMDNDILVGVATAYSSIKNPYKFSNDDLKLFHAIAPFIIESIKRMKHNNDNTLVFNENSTQDADENLDILEKTISDVQAPDEILNFVSNIVHDIRTPANGLLGFLEILEEQIDDERLKKYVNHARNSAFLINDLTTSILDGVSEKRELPIQKQENIDTIKFFSDIGEMFSANMFKKSINYNIFIDPLLPKEIKLNSIKIKRVIMNLLGNAYKFTPENGSIEFSVRYKQKEKKLHIFVKDSGIGIAIDKQEKIFEAFEQAEDNTKSVYGGTGLGLSICATYVKDMDGKLLIESKPNHGSTFYFDIPMEIKDYASTFEAVSNESVCLNILMSKANSFVANHISRYLVKIGVNIDNIHIITNTKDISTDITHLITFENKLSKDILLEDKKVKQLVVEENFLGLKNDNLNGAMLISQYAYFGTSLYDFVDEDDIPRVLIVEDDNISVILIRKMLENEYCKIDTADNGRDGLALLTSALNNSKPYNIVYTDHAMPFLSGTSMLKEYKELEAKSKFKKTFAASVSGDVKDETRYLYDNTATKPFKKKEIVSLFLQAIK